MIPDELMQSLLETMIESSNAIRLLAFEGQLSEDDVDSKFLEMQLLLEGIPDQQRDEILFSVTANFDEAKHAAKKFGNLNE